MKNLIGIQFGKLKVESVHSKTRNGHIRYTCLCQCGNYANILGTHLLQGNTQHCGCGRPKSSAHPQWTGVGDMSGNFWNHIVRGANGQKTKSRRKVPLTITKEEAWNLFILQDRKCALSGIILKFPNGCKDKSFTASLDRIDSSKGYENGNVQWVHKDINIMKNKFENQYFINMCKRITEWKH